MLSPAGGGRIFSSKKFSRGGGLRSNNLSHNQQKVNHQQAELNYHTYPDNYRHDATKNEPGKPRRPFTSVIFF